MSTELPSGSPYRAPSSPVQASDAQPAPRPWVAALLSFVFGPGVGHLYADRAKRAAGVWLLQGSVLAATGLAFTRSVHAGFALFAVAALVWLGCAIDAALTARRAARRAPWLRVVAALVVLGVVAQGAASWFRWAVLEPLVIPSAAMAPTLQVGDSVLVDKGAYRARDPLRGEIAVFRFPDNPRLIFIKRLIGLPGDEIEISGSDVTVNGHRLERTVQEDFVLPEYGPWKGTPMQAELERTPEGFSYLVLHPVHPPFATSRRWTVPPDSYFVLGDNRDQSADSRNSRNTFVPRANLLGQVVSRYFSRDPQSGEVRLERFGPLETPAQP
jgi:signal peptidase I